MDLSLQGTCDLDLGSERLSRYDQRGPLLPTQHIGVGRGGEAVVVPTPLTAPPLSPIPWVEPSKAFFAKPA